MILSDNGIVSRFSIFLKCGAGTAAGTNYGVAK